MSAEAFKTGTINDLVWRPLKRFDDKRGWLCEMFRTDDLPAVYRPEMGYMSMSWAGVSRGPHEHVDQADLFCFVGPGNFKVYLWDNREKSSTYRVRETRVLGEGEPMALIIPPGIVHAYRNVSDQPGIVYNYPNQLYKGSGRKQPVDEIRHEDDPNTIYVLD